MLHTRKLLVMQPTQQQLLDYTNALLLVNSYAYAITNQQLPVLSSPPKDYADFATLFTPAKQHALDWSSNIFVSIVQLPQTITQGAATLFDLESTYIEAYLDKLIADPGNAAARKGLADALTVLEKSIRGQASAVQSLETQLAAFGSNIAADAPVLTSIAQKALDAVISDKAKIDDINADIAKAREAIKTAQTLLTVSEIGIVLSIFVGLIGLVLIFTPATKVGVALLVVGIAGTAASITGTVLESVRIKALQEEILANQSQLAGVSGDVILLNGVADQFKGLYEANLKAQGALGSIKGMWSQLETAVVEVRTALTHVDSDTTSAQYRQALDDFKAAEAGWKAVVDFADKLAKINYNWQDAHGTWHTYSAGESPTVNSGNVVPLSGSHAKLLREVA